MVEVMNEALANSALEAEKTRTLEMIADFEAFAKIEEKDRSQQVFSRLQLLVNHAVQSSWWSDRLGPYQNDIRTSKTLPQLLGSLPVLERADLQNYSQWMQTWVPGSDVTQYFQASSSGSTGKPVTVTKFAPSQTLEYQAVELLDWKWQKLDLDKDFLVFTNREVPEPNPAQIAAPLVYIGASGRVFYRTLTAQPLQEVVEFLATEDIYAMLTTPTNLRQLVAEVAKSKVIPRALKFVLSFADRVDPGLRTLTADILGSKILDRFSTEELGPLAIQCPYHEHLHALQLHNYLEILDHNNRPCGPEQVGRVVVTALGSFAQPLIRYDIGDTASFGQPCDSEIRLPVLSPEIVRMRESYIDSRGAIINILPDKAEFTKMPSLRDFQIIIFQNRIVLLMVGEIELTDSLERAIAADLVKVTGMDKDTLVLIVPPVNWMMRHKRRAVVIVDEPAPEPSELDSFRKYAG